MPVALDVGVIDRRLPESAEAARYVVAEALTNETKHAQACEVEVSAEADGASLRLSIRDDGRLAQGVLTKSAAKTASRLSRGRYRSPVSRRAAHRYWRQSRSRSIDSRGIGRPIEPQSLPSGRHSINGRQREF